MQGTTAPNMEQAFGVSNNKGQVPVDVTVIVPSGSEESYKGTILKTHVTTNDSGNETTKPGISYKLDMNTTVSIVNGEIGNLGAAIVPEGWKLSVDPSSNNYVTIGEPDAATGAVTATANNVGSVFVTFSITNENNIVLAEQTCTINVVEKTVPATGVTLDSDSLSLRKGNTAKLTAKVTPEDTTDKVSWTSSDETVVTVDQNGNITAVGTGTATITATARDGVSATCEVTVKKKSSSGGSSSSSTYSVSTVKAEDGKITVSPAKAEKGDTVTITVKPDAGYVLDELVITDKKGNEIDYKAKGDNKFTFKMPASKVEIEAIFAPEKEEERTIVLTLGSTAASVFGTPVINDVAPIARNNRTMLPIRFIAEALGARVDWDAANQKVTIARDTLVIEIFLGSDVAYVNGQPVQLDSPAFAENNRTYLPLRFVAENLGAVVDWDASTQTVTITAA